MRVSVAVGILYFLYVGVLAHLLPVPRARRLSLDLGVAGLVLAGVSLQLMRRSLAVSIALDWLPGLYLLVGYWLPARLPGRPRPQFEARLREVDGRLFERRLGWALAAAPRLVLEYLEAAYLCCYLIVPAALGWLYMAHRRGAADAFWTAVLVAALPCYALLPWLQTRPPRRVERTIVMETRGLTVRRINRFVMDRASVGWNTFPSGHVAASLAAAAAAGAAYPPAGAVLGLVASSIAIASVAGRYHYAVDAGLGALAAAVGFAASRLV